MSNSTHLAEVFRVTKLSKHPNADKLEIMQVFDNYQALVRIGDFKIGDLACYVCPDSILPDKPEYAFLAGHLRIKAQKLRGVMSQGLVLKAPEGSKEGDDVAELLGVIHYVPKMRYEGAKNKAGYISEEPPLPGQKYDVDSWFRYGSLIPDGTLVEVTEKIHGGNARFSYQNGKFWAGSRNYYRKEDESGIYWRVFHENPWIKRLCKQNPDCIVYGEIFGNVQSLKYGVTDDSVYFRVFDILTPLGFMDRAQKIEVMMNAMLPSFWEIFCYKAKNFISSVNNLRPINEIISSLTLPLSANKVADCHVPVLYLGTYDKEIIEHYISGPSLIPGANHIREGIVIKPLEGIWNPRIGRVVLKAVSPEYLSKS